MTPLQRSCQIYRSSQSWSVAVWWRAAEGSLWGCFGWIFIILSVRLWRPWVNTCGWWILLLGEWLLSMLLYTCWSVFLWVLRRLCKAKRHMAEVCALCTGLGQSQKPINLILFQKLTCSDFCSLWARDCSTIYNVCPSFSYTVALLTSEGKMVNSQLWSHFTLRVLQLEKHSIGVKGETGPHSHTAVLNILQFSRGTM